MSFLQSAVEYLGHRIDAAGLYATTATIDGILNVPRPADVHQLRSFLTLISHFIPKLATVACLANSLLKLLVK